MLHVAIIAAAKSASVFRSLTTLKDQVSNEGSIELKGETIGDGIRTCPRCPPLVRIDGERMEIGWSARGKLVAVQNFSFVILQFIKPCF